MENPPQNRKQTQTQRRQLGSRSLITSPPLRNRPLNRSTKAPTPWSALEPGSVALPPRPLRRGRHTPPHSHSAHRMVQARNTRAPRRPRAHATPLTRHRTHTDSRRHFNCLTVIIAGRPFSRSRHRASVDAILAMASRRILVHTPPLTDDEINCVCV